MIVGTRRVVLTASLVSLAAFSIAWAHEERLVIGQVERIDLASKLLVVHDQERDRDLRIAVDADTEVRHCRSGAALAAVKPGARIRIKYLDRGAARLETLSVLVLPEQR